MRFISRQIAFLLTRQLFFHLTEQARIRAEQEEREAEERARIDERRRAMAAEAEAKAQEEKDRRLAERRADQEKIMAQARREEEALARRQGNRPVAPAAAGPAIPGTAAYRAARGGAPTPPPAASSPSGERPRFQLQPRSVSNSQPASTESTPPASRDASEVRRPGAPPVIGEGRPAGGAPSWREREAARIASGGGSATPPPPVGAAAAADSPPPARFGGKWTAARQSGEHTSPILTIQSTVTDRRSVSLSIGAGGEASPESSRPSTPGTQGKYVPPARNASGSRW